MSIEALITDISRGSLHDGPGVRTVVYFKGCGLRCQWCHNPETHTLGPQILFAASKCIGCGKCIHICADHHFIQEGQTVYRRQGCTGCGRCVEACPAGALSVVGRSMSVEQVLDVVLKDKHYYDASGGGVTFSGGECLLYPDFVEAVAGICQQKGIHTAVETALFIPWENVERVRGCTDLFYVDLKLADGEKHQEYTGQTQDKILQNLRELVKTGAEVVIRIPLIPQVNDTVGDMERFAQIIRSLEGGVSGVELLKYNHLAGSKYALLDMPYTAFAADSQTDEHVRELREALASALAGKCKVIC